MNSFIIPFWSSVFDLLGRVSIFKLVWWLLPKSFKTYAMVDAWVLGNFAASIIALAIVCNSSIAWIVVPIILYAAQRIIEATVYQINVVFFDAYRWAKSGGLSSPIKGYRRIVILILQNYAEMVFWFAALYSYSFLHFKESDTNPHGSETLKTFIGSLFHSVETMATLEPTFVPADDFGRSLTIIHICVGVFVGIVVLGSVIGLLPQRPSLDEYFNRPEDAK